MQRGLVQRILTGRLGVRLTGGGWSPDFLLRDDFTTAEAAPLASPRTCEPGPGDTVIGDANEYQSIANGAVRFYSGAVIVTTNDSYMADGPYTRAAGLAHIVTAKNDVAGNGRCQIGWGSALANAIDKHSLYISSGVGLTRRVSGVADTGESLYPLLTLSVYSDYAVILRANGALYAAQDDGAWRLIWVGNTDTTASLYARIQDTGVGVIDFSASTFRVLPLPAPFNSDYGLATNRIAGAVSAGATFVHEADCLIEFVVTTLPSAGTATLFFRIQDTTNYWRYRFLFNGSMALDEIVDNVTTLRGSTGTGVISDGHRVVIVADGTTIRVYTNNVLRFTYSSASNFATETDAELDSLGTGGAVSDVVAWPRVLTGQAKTLLDAAIDA